VSVEFTILCTRSPEQLLDKKVKGLRWDATKQSGEFGTMGLRQRALRESDKFVFLWADVDEPRTPALAVDEAVLEIAAQRDPGSRS